MEKTIKAHSIIIDVRWPFGRSGFLRKVRTADESKRVFEIRDFLSESIKIVVVVKVIGVNLYKYTTTRTLARMFELFEMAQNIPRVTLSPRQQATLTRLEGFRYLRRRSFHQARTCFWDAFIMFTEAGVDKQVHCLQFCGLSALCCRETVSVFTSPEANHLAVHPVTAPIAQLTDAYLEPNIRLFTDRIDSASRSFGNKPEYNKLLDEVRLFVLEKCLLVYCPLFSVVTFEYAARELASNESEIRDVVQQLILRRALKGLMDEDRSMVYMEPVRQKSVFVQNIRLLVEGMERVVGELFTGRRA